jgi:predicted dehydrogenase
MPFMITVIGCGWVSMECHGPAYVEYARSHPDVLLAACCDVDPQRSEEFRVRFSFRRAYRDYLDMLENEQPQAVALNVPPQAMCLLGCDILRRGYPLICEKPPGLSLAEIDQWPSTVAICRLPCS